MQLNQADIVLAQDLYYLIHKVDKDDLSEYAIVSPLILIDYNKHQYKAEEDQLQLDVQTIKTKVDSAVHNSEDDAYTIFPKQLRIRKQVNYYESDNEWESSQSSAESESSISNIESKVIEKKQRAPRQKKQDKQIKQKQPNKKRQAESIKNPNYTEQVRENPQLCGNSNQMTDYESQKMNNREIIRAARTGNLELIKNIQSQQYYRKINSYYDHWAIENDVTAIDLIFQRQDTEMLRAILNTSFYYIPQTQASKLKGIETGYNDQYAYGRRTRKVAAGRGNREGNNALNQDQEREMLQKYNQLYSLQSDSQKGSRKKRGYHHQQKTQSWISIGLKKLMTTETDPTMFDILVVTHNVAWDGLNEVVPFAVRSGNFKTAGHIVKRLFEQGQTYGFNQVHVTVLTETNGQDFDQIKKASSTKQNQGQRLITPIHCAAINPNGAYLAHLLDVSQEFNIVDEELNKPIHYAAASQTTGTVEVLIERKADLREGNKYKTTPLMIAAKNGRAHNIPLLILDNIHQRDKLGYAAIHYAAVNGSIETIQALLEHGAKVNQPGPNRSTPLSLAASYGHFALVRYLHSQKAKVTSKDKYGRSPLIMAARNGNLEILSYLLIHGGQPNEPDSSGNTPLHYAAAYGFPYCIEELIKAGADQNLMNSWKLTPLSVAIQKNHFGIVKRLLNYPGTDVDCRDDDGRTLLLNTLLDFTLEQYSQIEFLVVEKKANVNIADLKGQSPIHVATSLDYNYFYQKQKNYLINEEVKAQFQSQVEETILKLINLLVQYGANIYSLDQQGQTPFMRAMQQKNYTMIKILMPYNTDFNVIDHQGKNILHLMIDWQMMYNKQGFQIFNDILDRLSSEAVHRVDDLGFTAILSLINTYSQKAAELLNQKYNKIFNKRVQKCKNEKRARALNNPDYENDPEEYYQRENIYIESQRQQKSIGLTRSEQQSFQEQAQQKADKLEERVLMIYKRLLVYGADQNFTVQNLRVKRLVDQIEEEELKYGPQGKQNMAHFMFSNYHNIDFMNKLMIDNWNLQDNNGDYPIHLLCNGNTKTDTISKQDTTTFLTFAFSRIDIQVKNKNLQTAAHILGIKANFNQLRQVFSVGGHLNSVSRNNQVPLYFWIQRNNLNLVQQLLDMKADPNFRDREGRTALHHALNISSSSVDASFEMEQLLLDHGALQISDRYGRTPLFYAFLKFQNQNDTREIDPFETVSNLIADINCDLNVVDIYGRNALHYAACRGANISSRYMIKMGIKFDLPDQQGNTPMGLAFAARHANVCTMLLDLKADMTRTTNIIVEEDNQADTDQEDDFYVPHKRIVPLPYTTMTSQGAYSNFKLSIQNSWHGVAYLLISDGFDLGLAIEDAMSINQHKLVKNLLRKVKYDEIVQRCNAEGQNLFHIFATKGTSAQMDIAQLIIEELIRRKVDPNQQDKQGYTAFHYSILSNFDQLTEYLLDICDANISNNDGDTPFTLWFKIKFVQSTNSPNLIQELQKWQSKGANFSINILINDQWVSPYLYLIRDRHIDDITVLQFFTNNGCDINESQSLHIAIQNNSIELVKFIINNPKFDKSKHQQNINGQTPIHLTVQPLEYGSYENIEILELLIPLYDISSKDSKGLTPLDYANDQDSGIMKGVLLKYGATGSRFNLKRMATSIVSESVYLPAVDYESDALEYLNKQKDEIVPIPIQVDCQAKQSGGVAEIHENYSLLMTKVDLANGPYSENVFYKMQIIHELNRDVFILFTNWGRIGTPGQCQLTPFLNAEMTVAEFCKIFQSKSGNSWNDIQAGKPFDRKLGKYLLIQNKQQSHRSHLRKPDYIQYPIYTINKDMARVIHQFIDVEFYQQQLSHYNIDQNYLSLDRIDHTLLQNAKQYLLHLVDLINELNQLRQQHLALDLKAILNLVNEINEQSSRYYELIVIKNRQYSALPPFQNIQEVQQQLQIIEQLLHISISTKIILGALNAKIHPLDYAYAALQIRTITLPRDHPEFQLIQNYANLEGTIKNIFALERKGEHLDQSKQRLLLWHGSKVCNYLSILSQGLKIQPPWVQLTGSAFGKGIYFADRFQKSYNYSTFSQTESQRYSYLLLCEVAVGNQHLQYNNGPAFDNTKFDSVKAMGSQIPDPKQNITLINGCLVPAGKIITAPSPPEKMQYSVRYNEYIIYDEAQVKIRYLIQIDNRRNPDLFYEQ